MVNIPTLELDQPAPDQHDHHHKLDGVVQVVRENQGKEAPE
jgi:hypothetical protein